MVAPNVMDAVCISCVSALMEYGAKAMRGNTPDEAGLQQPNGPKCAYVNTYR